LRRFLAKCRSRYHYSIWDKRRARLTGKTDGSVRKRPAMGRETCVAVAHYRRRELEGLPRRLTSASGRGANVGFWRGLAVPGPVQSGSCGRYFRSARLRSSRGSSTAAGFVEGSLSEWSRVYPDEDAQPAGFLTQPLQRLREVPSPPSICWPISAIAR
jgi:hypothetical protein